MTWGTKKPTEPERIMFDIETLDIQPTAVVLTLGITNFKITSNDTFMDIVDRGLHLVLEPEHQKNAGSTTSQDTIDWWAQQDQKAQEVLLNGTLTVPELPDLIRDHFDFPLGKALWYCRGPAFDVAIVQNMLNNFGLPTLWKYSNARDTRTWFDFYPGWVWSDKPKEFVAHNALHDSAMEVIQMQQAYRSVNS